MGEALRGPSPCMPYSVSNKTKKKKLKKEKKFFSLFLFFFQNKSPSSGEARKGFYYSSARGRLAWCLLCAIGVLFSNTLFAFLAARLAQPNKTFFKKEKHCVFYYFFKKNFIFFDSFCLQTWAWQDYPPNLSILLSGGKENNRDSLSQRRAKRDRTRCRIGPQTALSCGINETLWMVREWRNSSAKQTHCWTQPFMWVLSQRRC